MSRRLGGDTALGLCDHRISQRRVCSDNLPFSPKFCVAVIIFHILYNVEIYLKFEVYFGWNSR